MEVDASPPSPDRETEGPYKIGDVLETIVKVKRGKASIDRPRPEKRVIVWVDDDAIATVPYSDFFDNLEYFTSQNPITWQHRKAWELNHTGKDIYQHRDAYRESLKRFRAEQDKAASKKPFELKATAARYTSDSEVLDKLISEANALFEVHNLEAEFGAKISENAWSVEVSEREKYLGRLIFHYLPEQSDPNENLDYFGEYEGYWWNACQTLEPQIYDRDLVDDLERLAAPLEIQALKADSNNGKAQFKKGDKVDVKIAGRCSQEFPVDWNHETYSAILSPKPLGEPTGTATVLAGQIQACAQNSEPLEPTPANLFRGHKDTHTLPKKRDWKAELEADNPLKDRSILDFQIGDRVFDKRYPDNFGTVEKS